MAVPPTLRTPPTGSLFDELSRPDFRDVFGYLCHGARAIRTAVTRVRISTLNLTAEELAGVEDFRVIVADVSALQLTHEARAVSADPRRAERLGMIRGLLESQRLQVRSAPLAGWSPDFTVFVRPDDHATVLTGFHWFERPYPNRGPALSGLHEGEAARLAAARHDALWQQAHDVGPAVWNILSKAERIVRGIRAVSG